MSERHQIHAIILTLNEEMHLGRCIEGLNGQCASVTVVDSGSTDRTVEIAERHGAEVLRNTWINYARQMNFAIDALAGRGGWLLRIDADEVLDPDTQGRLVDAVSSLAPGTNGVLVQRRIHFLGRRIRYGGIEPSWQLRLWRNGHGRCEQRWMDEHIRVDGDVTHSRIVLSDINLNSLTWWTAKHNSYASREAIDMLNTRHDFLPVDQINEPGASSQAKARRFMKEKVYLKLPAGARAFGYFVYRYILRLGFLDRAPGFYFHLLQGLWYRTLVDAKVSEILAFADRNQVSIVEAIRARTGVDPVAKFPSGTPRSTAAGKADASEQRDPPRLA